MFIQQMILKGYNFLMCGRYVAPDGTLIEGATRIDVWLSSRAVYKVPSTVNYNAAPTQFLPVVTEDGATLARFGLIPSWARDLKYSMINAMGETLTEKKSFKGLLKHNRCLVPAMGFYEWRAVGSEKTPYYITLKDKKVFSFAGLYTHRTDPDGYTSYSFTIITTEANELVKDVHGRMPVILAKKDEQIWLEGTTDEALKLIAPYSAPGMQMWEVGREVGNVRNNTKELIMRK